MKHFILTHFNQKLWFSDKNRQQTHTSEWLDRRFELFEQFCFPSICAQTDDHFMWLCLFDIDTPQPYLERIEHYKSILPQFIPLFLTEEASRFEHDAAVKLKIKELITDEDDYIITTQLDNDDALHRDFIQRVNQLSTQYPTHNTVLLFNYGYQYFEPFGFLLKLYYPNNHFPVLIENNLEEIQLAFSINHSHLRKKHLRNKYQMVAFDNKKEPFWMEVVHSKNVSNDVRITFRPKDMLYLLKQRFVLPQFYWADFGINACKPLKHQVWKFLRYYIPSLFKQLLRKLTKRF